jgi:hypothetical protein
MAMRGNMKVNMAEEDEIEERQILKDSNNSNIINS